MSRSLKASLAVLLPTLLPAQEEHPVNRLAKESSPYLRQHQHNPVDWYPWGQEALAKARAEDKPIFLSIGYAACHWCHVMERESFESEEIAAVMNEHFVCIKVDREERPDLDEIYMAAVQAMTGSGGWPMSVWMTPDLKPFYGGTYYPPDDRYGRPGFKRVLESMADAWRDRREQVVQGSEELTAHLAKVLVPEFTPGEPELAFADKAAEMSAQRYDPVHAGFGAAPDFAPKFPHAAEISVLLRHSVRTGAEESRKIALTTLRRMAEGGMYDQLGGGFHRYSTDRIWLVPHFEKMLYDNALLVPCYLEAFQLTGDEFYARIARESLDYMLREMQHDLGGFYSTQDADSEGVEGKFFVWKKAEVDELLGDDAELAALHWGITEPGNWEHDNVLFYAMAPAAVAAKLELPEAEVTERLQRARKVLLAAREPRVHPATDDKVLTAWNGMAIAALAQGHQVLGDRRYLDAAQKAASFALAELRRDGRLVRTWRDGDARLMGYLEDYGFLADGLLHLFEADFDPTWLREAKALLDQAQAHFRDPADGAFFFTADDHEELLTRTKSVSESSTPSGTAMVVRALLRAGLLLGDEELVASADATLRVYHTMLSDVPAACNALVLGVQFHLGDPREVVIAGAPDDPATQALLRAARSGFTPPRVVAVVHDGNRAALEKLSPLFAGKTEVDGKPAAYVCRRGVCAAPVTDPAALELR